MPYTGSRLGINATLNAGNSFITNAPAMYASEVQVVPRINK